MGFDMRVGIVDSGINSDAVKSVVHQWDFARRDTVVSFGDRNGHGTMAAKVLEEYSRTPVEFFSARIFGDRLATDIKTLIRALEFLGACDLDLLHMSISVAEDIVDKDVERICRNMLDHGTKIVTAYSNKLHRTSLDQIEGIIIVEGRDLEDSACYWFNDSMGSAIADKAPMLVAYGQDQYRFYNGNSKAASVLTSHLMRCFDQGSREIKMDLFKSRAWGDVCIETGGYQQNHMMRRGADAWECLPCDLRRMVETILMEVLQIYDRMFLREHDWIGFPVGINGMKAFDVIRRIETECNVRFDMKDIFLSYFSNYESFGYLLKNNLMWEER